MLGFDNLRLGKKLGLLVALVMTCAALSSFAIANLLRAELLTSRLEELRAVTDTVKGIATDLQAQVASGQLSREDAIKTFGTRVRAMTYNGDQGYVFAYTMDGVTVASPDPRQLGTNRLDIPVNGRPVIREIRDAVQATGEAVIRYEYPRPGTAAAVPKISIATEFAPWHIFYGTGAYVDDLDIRFGKVVRLLVAGLAGFLIVFGGSAWLISRRITRPLARLQHSMKQLSEGDLDADVPGTDRRDEVGAMAGAVLVFKENALRAQALEREQREANARRAAEDEHVRREAEASAAAAAAAMVVGSIGRGLEALSVGDLTLRLETALPEDYEKLRTDFNAAMGQVADLVRSIVTITGSINAGSNDVAQAADDLSKRTEQQAASLEQSAAALQQLTSTVRKTAENAMNVSQVVARTKTDAQQSGEIVRKAIGAMGSIERSSSEISQIIAVIDEIAFQTNLLALNAGVEAARAGDSGRGFAVVASEVRALAQRSAEAAKQIKTLISTSANEVGVGVGLVNEAGKSLDRIVSQVAEITVTVSEMAASAQEQATGLNEVNAAVNHMDRVTQQNAAMVEESTAASHALGQETAELVRLTMRFQVEPAVAETTSARSRRPGAARPPLALVS